MTLEITEFRCPTCGHLLGEEEYMQAWNEINKIVIERTKEHDSIKDEQHRKELQRQELVEQLGDYEQEIYQKDQLIRDLQIEIGKLIRDLQNEIDLLRTEYKKQNERIAITMGNKRSGREI
jgi:hypothetical protein